MKRLKRCRRINCFYNLWNNVSTQPHELPNNARLSFLGNLEVSLRYKPVPSLPLRFLFFIKFYNIFLKQRYLLNHLRILTISLISLFFSPLLNSFVKTMFECQFDSRCILYYSILFFFISVIWICLCRNIVLLIINVIRSHTFLS